jgi:hypothetical protein
MKKGVRDDGVFIATGGFKQRITLESNVLQ